MVTLHGNCSSNDNKLFRRSDSLLLIQHYIYKRHCINCNVQLHSMIAVKDINRYELHFRQFMLMANTNISPLIKDLKLLEIWTKYGRGNIHRIYTNLYTQAY